MAGFGSVGGFTKGPGLPKPPAPKVGFGTSGNPSWAKVKPPGFLAGGAHVSSGLVSSVLPKASPQQGAGAAAGGGGTAPAPLSPYDPQYFNDLTIATNKANNAVAGYNQDISNAGTTLGQNQADLARNLALQTMNAQNTENARGGFAQGALGQTVGNLNTANAAQAYALQTKYQNDKDTWTNAITAANSGLSTETIALQLASAARQATAAAASGGTLGTPAPAGAPSTAPPAPARTAPATAPKAKSTPLKINVPKVGRNQIGYHGGF